MALSIWFAADEPSQALGPNADFLGATETIDSVRHTRKQAPRRASYGGRQRRFD